MIISIILYILAIPLGFVSFWFAVGLDSMMDWGGFFQKIRFKKFLKYAKDNHKDLIVRSALVHSLQPEQGEQKGTARANFMASLYYELAAEVLAFKLWVCVQCMSVRIALYLNICLYIFALYFSRFEWLILFNYPFTFMVAISVIYYQSRNVG